MRASLVLVCSLALGTGCRTPGGKIAGSFVVVGLGAEVVGAMQYDEDHGPALVIGGALLASYAALAWVFAEDTGRHASSADDGPQPFAEADAAPEAEGARDTSCSFGDCDKNGRTERRSDGTSSNISCSWGDCNKNGWTERRSDGTSSDIRCSFGDCNKNGWTERHSDETSTDVRCSWGDCNKNGATKRHSDGTSTDISCSWGDCNKNGWTERRSDGTSVHCSCNWGDCNANGATCR